MRQVPVGAGQGGLEGAETGFGGGDLILAGAELRGLQIGLKLRDALAALVPVGTGAVEVLLGGAAGNGGEFVLAGQFLRGERERGLGFLDLGLERLDFGRASAFFQVFQSGASLGQLFGGLIARGLLGRVVQREKGIAGADVVAALDGEGVERSGHGRGDIDVFPLHITLHGGRGRSAAAGQEAADGEEKEVFEAHAFPFIIVCSMSSGRERTVPAASDRSESIVGGRARFCRDMNLAPNPRPRILEQKNFTIHYSQFTVLPATLAAWKFRRP